VIAEGNETPGSESGGGAEGRGRRSEGDLLAERRARRAAESGEHALTLRAEAAEATVRTLETHVASLQQRLRDAEQEGQRMSELIDATQAARVGDRPEIGERSRAVIEPAVERELQRASQREYAEQRLRMEAEDRCGEVEREARAEVDRLSRRLGASEREAQDLAVRLESAQRELAEAEQTAAAERTAVLRTERSLQARLGELEQRAIEIHHGLEAERAERERAERLLEEMRRTHRSAQGLVGELADALARLKGVAAPRAQPQRPATAQAPLTEPAAPPAEAAAPPAEPAEAPLPPPARVPLPHAAAPPSSPGGTVEPRGEAGAQARSAEMAEALAAAVERLRARVEEQVARPPAKVAPDPPHKHSMSLITRWRIALRGRRERRKQRRER
jgi:chromosome segregation ATPase